MVWLALTRRRQQFLAQVVKLYQEKQEPVHYEIVAEALGVSRWTAYDMLKALEQQGLLEAQYIVKLGSKLPGRSMVRFRPTSKAYGFVCSPGPSDDWHTIKEQLLSSLRQTLGRLQARGGSKSDDASQLAQRMLDEGAGQQSPLNSSAYTLAALVISLRALGERGTNLGQRLIAVSSRPELGLATFAGTALGSLTRTATSFNLVSQAAEKVRQLTESLAKIAPQELLKLKRFLEEALRVGQ